jgi:ribonucleoside-diphosphate reductase beta chain
VKDEMSLLKPKGYYKPFLYPEMFEAYKAQHSMHWMPETIPLASDVRDFKQKATPGQQQFIKNVLLFFTQADVDVAAGYIDKIMPWIKNEEARMALLANASFEPIHMHAYAYLTDTLGLEGTYRDFMEYASLKAKHDYINDFEVEDVPSLIKFLAVNGIFGEGMMLFSAFAALLGFQRFNLFNGMCTQVEYSIKDESHHVATNVFLFRQLVKENPEVWTDAFKADLYQTARDMVNLEDKFIELAFETGEVPGMTQQELHNYIRYIADRRLLSIGLKANYGIEENPLPWIDQIVGGVMFTNFFENRATEYAKGTLTGSWNNVWASQS